MKKTAILFLLLPFWSVGQNLDYRKECQNAISSLDDFYTQKFSQKGLTLIRPKRSFYAVNSPIKTGCGEIYSPNAFYCPADNSIYLNHELFAGLTEKYNNNGLFYFILAHEYGHLVQNQLDLKMPLSTLRELHADCLGGVYFRNLSASGVLEESDVTAVKSFLIDFSTENAGWDNLTVTDAHGDGQTRVKAFDFGFRCNSIMGCTKEYNENPEMQQQVKGFVDLWKKVKGNK